MNPVTGFPVRCPPVPVSVLCQSLCRYCFGTAFGTATGTVSVLFRPSVVPAPVLLRYCLGTAPVLLRTFDRSRKCLAGVGANGSRSLKSVVSRHMRLKLLLGVPNRKGL